MTCLCCFHFIYKCSSIHTRFIHSNRLKEFHFPLGFFFTSIWVRHSLKKWNCPSNNYRCTGVSGTEVSGRVENGETFYWSNFRHANATHASIPIQSRKKKKNKRQTPNFIQWTLSFIQRSILFHQQNLPGHQLLQVFIEKTQKEKCFW